MRKPPLQDVIVMNTGGRVRPQPYEGVDGVAQRQRSSIPITHDEYQRPRERGDILQRRSHDTENQQRPLSRPPHEYGEEKKVGSRWVWVSLVVGGAVVATAYILSILFSGASIIVYPKQDTIVANASFTAREDGNDDSLVFKRMTIERVAKREVPAAKEEQVEEWAQGKITIYNEFSESAQRLIKKTRFQAEDGKVYRIQESVEVPGKSRNGSPGTIEATVVAEESGESYNRGPSSFSVPGFKGYPQDGKIYARSTSDISGGFSGVRRTIAETDRVGARESLESELRALLIEEAMQSADKPEGYHVFKEAIFFEFVPLPDESSGAEQVNVSLSGKLHAILFPDVELAKKVAERTIGGYDGAPTRIDNLDETNVSVKPIEDALATTSVLPWESEAYTVSVSGKVALVWEFDESSFIRDIVGKDIGILDREHPASIHQNHRGIDRIVPSIRPFWKKVFPKDPSDIKVVLKLDE